MNERQATPAEWKQLCQQLTDPAARAAAESGVTRSITHDGVLWRAPMNDAEARAGANARLAGGSRWITSDNDPLTCPRRDPSRGGYGSDRGF